jgi:hypothetical protein
MEIRLMKADVFEHAVENTDAAVVWGRSGFNVFSGLWWRFADRLPDRVRSDLSSRPWTDPSDYERCLVLEPRLGSLRWLYFLANEDNGFTLADFETRVALERALRSLNDVGARSLSIMIPPAVPGTQDLDAHLARLHLATDVIVEHTRVLKTSHLRRVDICTLSGALLRRYEPGTVLFSEKPSNA